MSKLSELLHGAVARSALSKTAIAKDTGISRTALFHLLKGTSLPKRSTLEGMIACLNLDEEKATAIRHAFEAERYATINTARKEVRTAKDMFLATLLETVHGLTLADRTGDGWAPDLWALTSLGEFPVFAEMKILDHHGIFGRAVFNERKSVHGSLPDWKTWICVPDLTDSDRRFNEEVSSIDFKLTIVTPDGLRQGIRELEAIAEEALLEENAQDHIELHLDAD